MVAGIEKVDRGILPTKTKAKQIMNNFCLKGCISKKHAEDIEAILLGALLELKEEEMETTKNAILMSKQGWIEQGVADERKRIKKRIERMKELNPCENCITKENKEACEIYNQALEDILKEIKKL